MLLEPLQFNFFKEALIAGLLASVCCGLIGSFVVVKRLSSLSGGVSHAALGGVGLGCFFGFQPMLGASFVAVLSAVVMGFFYRKQREGLDTAIAVIWAMGMSLGILFLALTPGYLPDLSSYLFGNILFVRRDFIDVVLLFDAVVLGFVWIFYSELQAITFDEEFSEVAGLPVDRFFYLLLIFAAIAVVVLIKVVGVILTISLLTTPAALARHWSRQLAPMMLIATIISATAVVFGLYGTYWLGKIYALSIPTGPTIVLLLTFSFFASSLLRSKKN